MKVCPRCSYVDTGSRLVCSACRRSLVATSEMELDDVLALRERCLAGEVEEMTNAPWGPAVSRSEPALAGAAATGRSIGDSGAGTDQFAIPSSQAVSLFPSAPDSAATSLRDVHASESVDPEGSDVASATRDHLSRMYGQGATPADGEPTDSVPYPNAEARTAAPSVRSMSAAPAPAKKHGRRNLILVVAALVIGFLAAKWVSTAFDEDQAALLNDPNVAVGDLPWHRANYGTVSATFPGQVPRSVVTDGRGGTYEYESHDLSDVSIAVIVRDSFGINATDASLRSVASQRASEASTRLVAGTTSDLSFGTSFSMRAEGSNSVVYFYFLLVGGNLIEVQATVLSANSARALQIYEQAIRSFEPI